MKKYFILTALLITFYNSLNAQSSILALKSSAEEFYFDSLLIDVPLEKRTVEQGSLAYQFAIPVEPDYSIQILSTDGKYTDGFYHYLLVVKVDGATSINFSMNGMVSDNVACVFVQNNSTGKLSSPLYPSNNEEDITPFPIYSGDEIVLEIISGKILEKTRLARLGIEYGEKSILDSGECNIDINCPEGDDWQIDKMAVVKLVIQNTWLCTGTLMLPTGEENPGYVLTANHCIGTNSAALNTIFYFNYESSYCDSEQESENTRVLGSAYLKATKYDGEGALDFALLDLLPDIPGSIDVHYAGWSAVDVNPVYTVGIHHPMGDLKKICKDYDEALTSTFSSQYDESSFWRILEWDEGVTEGGSSGSALYNTDHRLVGTLTGGQATCENPVNDYYTKFSAAFDKYPDSSQQLKYWLDPANEGVLEWPIDTLQVYEELSFYPNPIKDEIYLKYTMPDGAEIRLLDLKGVLYFETHIEFSAPPVRINIPEVESGFYFLEVIEPNKKHTIKVYII